MTRNPIDRILAAVPHLPRPLVLLEDGLGRSGSARLAWGQRAAYRLQAGAARSRMEWLDRLPATRLYGFLGYDLGLPPNATRREPMLAQPVAELFEPEHEVILNFDTGAALGVALDSLPGGPVTPSGGGPGGTGRLVASSFTPDEFHAAARAAREYIASGDVYQVNLSVCHLFEVSGHPWDVYLRLRAINPSPWMGFADFGDWQIVSGSPELLVETRPGAGATLIRTRPIAGTRRKSGDPAEDARMRAELELDEKERAEHLMLVDLERNDVGRVARFGSLAVPEREVIEEYSHVFHLVSEVSGVLRPDATGADVLRAMFPGGTITGVPKIRALEVISELEPVARGAYTGSIGWMAGSAMQFNILIRSAVFRDGHAAVQAGAGIVWDSIPGREWKESLRKAAAVRAAIGAESVT